MSQTTANASKNPNVNRILDGNKTKPNNEGIKLNIKDRNELLKIKQTSDLPLAMKEFNTKVSKGSLKSNITSAMNAHIQPPRIKI